MANFARARAPAAARPLLPRSMFAVSSITGKPPESTLCLGTLRSGYKITPPESLKLVPKAVLPLVREQVDATTRVFRANHVNRV